MPSGDITGFNELVDVGDIFNPTTGRLSINDEQQEGKYVLHINAYKSRNNRNRGKIWVYKNQSLVQLIVEEDVENDSMMNTVLTLHLQKGDEVKLKNDLCCDKSIYVEYKYPLTFTGYKI